MICQVWNCRGLENLCTRKELGELVWAKDPSIMFLAETWADEAKAKKKKIKRDLDFVNMFFVPRINRGGGLALYWWSLIDVNVDNFSKNHIDAIINKGKDDDWRFTSFYGEPTTHLRHESWSLLCDLNNRLSLPLM